MRRKPPVFTSSAAESTKTYRPCSSLLTARLQWAAILGRPCSMAASPCWNCLRARRPSRGRRVSPRPVGATKNCASSGSTHSPKGDTEMAPRERATVWHAHPCITADARDGSRREWQSHRAGCGERDDLMEAGDAAGVDSVPAARQRLDRDRRKRGEES